MEYIILMVHRPMRMKSPKSVREKKKNQSNVMYVYEDNEY